MPAANASIDYVDHAAELELDNGGRSSDPTGVYVVHDDDHAEQHRQLDNDVVDDVFAFVLVDAASDLVVHHDQLAFRLDDVLLDDDHDEVELT